MTVELVSKKNWKRFIQEGTIEKNNMSNELIDSWQLCRQLGVNPFDGVATHILDPCELKRKLRENQLLLELAKPHIRNLCHFLNDWRFVTILTDKDGYILLKKGENSLKKEASEIRFKKGAKWVETEVGSNAIGLAQRFKKPFTVRGYEHFAIASQIWNCSAAPIVDRNHHLLGIINVSSLYPSINDHYVLSSVKLTADSISLDWRKKMQEDIEFLMKNNIHEDHPSILCTCDNIICSLPRKLLPSYQRFIGESLQKLREEIKVCETSIPITKENRIIGYRVPIDVSENRTSSVYFKGVKGTSITFQKVLEEVKKVASTDTTVHIYGETGTGKELIAKTIHDNSDRSNGPFVSLNCGAIPKQLLESELFGYEHGAFTGANKKGYKGKLEQANDGTLFLDEIGDMPKEMQVALLRVLQQKEVTRIGGTHPIRLNIRIITATNIDIRTLVHKGKMRKDLFYRIYVYPITIPPLRKRREDIRSLINDYCQRNKWYPRWIKKLEHAFRKGHWYGNVRELQNTLERCRILYSDQVPTERELHYLVSSLCLKDDSNTNVKGNDFRKELEMRNIKQALTKHNGNVTRAAKELNISRSTLYRKIKRYEL